MAKKEREKELQEQCQQCRWYKTSIGKCEECKDNDLLEQIPPPDPESDKQCKECIENCNLKNRKGLCLVNNPKDKFINANT